MTRVLIGFDHRGKTVAEHLADRLQQSGHEIELFDGHGEAPSDYPMAAYEVSRRVVDEPGSFGVLICGTGVGMSIAANKVCGVRAAAVHDEITAELSRAHLDANVCCLSADLLGVRLLEKVVERFLAATFDGGRHERRLERIRAIERGEGPGAPGGGQNG